MRHYEIVVLFDPTLPPERMSELVERYKATVLAASGVIHRFEDWGLRPLAYLIKKKKTAYYILMNIECDEKTRQGLEDSFKFDDSILRHLCVRMNEAVTGPSCIAQEASRPPRRFNDQRSS